MLSSGETLDLLQDSHFAQGSRGESTRRSYRLVG